jgi:hypothetical protein
MSEWPHFLGLESNPTRENWSVVHAPDAFALDRKIRAADGISFHRVGSEGDGIWHALAKKIEHALNRILGKVRWQHRNGPGATGLVAKRFRACPMPPLFPHILVMSNRTATGMAPESGDHPARCSRGPRLMAFSGSDANPVMQTCQSCSAAKRRADAARCGVGQC